MAGDRRGSRRDYKQEYNDLAVAIVGQTGLSAITEARKHLKMRDALYRIANLPQPGDAERLAYRMWRTATEALE